MPAFRRPRGDDGAAVVDFVLVGVLLVGVFAMIVQLGLLLHVRNVLVASAAEGARYGANADVPDSLVPDYTRRFVGDSLSAGVARRMHVAAAHVDEGGVRVVQVDIDGDVPLTLLPVSSIHLHARGRVLEEPSPRPAP